MIRKLTVDGLTVFATTASLTFEPGINILFGDNGSGKSHLLKLAYALCKWGSGGNKKELPVAWAEEKRLRLILMRVFALRHLTELTSQIAAPCSANVRVSLYGDKVPLGSAETAFSFRHGDEEGGLNISTLPQRALKDNTIFLPTQDVMPIYPCYAQAARRYPELLDAAGWDFCAALEEDAAAPLPPVLLHVQSLIEGALHGKLLRCNGRFILQGEMQPPQELNLVSAGMKRLGLLGVLISNGSIRPGTTLFWDTPETELNTAHLPLVVSILLGLCRAGVQVILSTHSLFLLREYTIQLSERNNRSVSRRFFELRRGAHGSTVCAGEALMQMDSLSICEAEATQADRYLAVAYGNPATLPPEA